MVHKKLTDIALWDRKEVDGERMNTFYGLFLKNKNFKKKLGERMSFSVRQARILNLGPRTAQLLDYIREVTCSLCAPVS